jgi:hypothetical protein
MLPLNQGGSQNLISVKTSYKSMSNVGVKINGYAGMDLGLFN